MKFKIKTIFKNVFDEEITDAQSPADAYAYLTINKKGLKDYKNLTVQALIACGLIPSIQTSDIKNERWFSSYMSFIVKSIYEDKYNDSYFKNKLLVIYCPEIDKLWNKDSGMDKGVLIKTELSQVGTNGRRAGIILIWDTQFYDVVPEGIRSNTPFLFVLRKGNREEAAGIKKDYGCDKEIIDWILGLKTEAKKGIFECVALTTRNFILYNPRDGTISETSEPQRGRLITPMAQHKNPEKSIDVVLGLKPDVGMKVEMLKPKTMAQKINELIQ